MKIHASAAQFLTEDGAQGQLRSEVIGRPRSVRSSNIVVRGGATHGLVSQTWTSNDEDISIGRA